MFRFCSEESLLSFSILFFLYFVQIMIFIYKLFIIKLLLLILIFFNYRTFSLRKYEKIWKNVPPLHTFLSIVMCKSAIPFPGVPQRVSA